MATDDKNTEKWIISMLLAAISGILWWLLLDTRADLTMLRVRVFENQLAIQSNCREQDRPRTNLPTN